MALDDEGSFTLWIGELKAGGDGADQQLWERCFDRLVRLARGKLRRTYRVTAAEDEIAGRLGGAEKSVTRKLNVIRSNWLREAH
jgi:hypothetical protein